MIRPRPIPRPPAWAAALLTASALILGAAASAPDDDEGGQWAENLRRAREMTVEERARMAERLRAFDALEPAERASIRDLDTRLRALEPDARRRSLAVLRRYHAFYTALPPEKRKTIDEAPDASTKLERIVALHAEQRATPALGRPLAAGLQVSALSPVRLRMLARHLIVYFSLDPVKDSRERAELARLGNPQQRELAVRKIIQAKALRDRQELREKLREEDEEFQAAEQAILQDPALARRLFQGEKEQEQVKAEVARRKAAGPRARDALAAKLKEPGPRRNDLVKKLDELEVLREMDEETVTAANLQRFQAALPPWALEGFDELPPDAARRRLKALYRLVFPSPEEIPETKAPPPRAPEGNRNAPPPAGGRPF